MDDREIISLFFGRDPLAVSELSGKYGRLLKQLSMRILGSDSDADECVNDALLALWNSIPPNRPDDVRAYACRIVRNLSLKRLKFNLAKKRSQNASVPFDGEFAEMLPDSLSQDDFQKIDLKIAINGFLELLRPDERAIFIRRYFMFDQISEISAATGFSQSKIKSTLSRTREKLRKYLGQEGAQE